MGKLKGLRHRHSKSPAEVAMQEPPSGRNFTSQKVSRQRPAGPASPPAPRSEARAGAGPQPAGQNPKSMAPRRSTCEVRGGPSKRCSAAISCSAHSLRGAGQAPQKAREGLPVIVHHVAHAQEGHLLRSGGGGGGGGASQPALWRQRRAPPRCGNRECTRPGPGAREKQRQGSSRRAPRPRTGAARTSSRPAMALWPNALSVIRSKA